MPSAKSQAAAFAKNPGWIAKHRNGAWYTVVLILVVAVVAGGVSAVAHYALTNPFKESDVALEEAKVGAKRTLIFPDSKSWEAVSAPAVDGLNKVWKSDAGDYCFDVQSDGYHGSVELMVGISKDGKVAGIQIISENETEGIGTNALTDDYFATYKDLEANGTLTVEDAQSGQTHVDGVSGATFTSKAVAADVSIAIEAYAQVGGK